MSEAASSESPEPAGPTGEAPWHSLSPEAVRERLDVGDAGLTAAEAAARLEAGGPNEIQRQSRVSPVRLFLAQFRDVLVYVLLVAAGLSLAVGALPGVEPDYVDATLVLLILLANGVFGFVQDYQAEQSIEALRELSAPRATVLRDGERVEVDATSLVPGDVLVLESGDAVPADARLVEANGLQTNESALTGESAAVEKGVDAVDGDAPLAERASLVFMNTTVVRGRGRAVVVETGMETAVGRIATQLQETEEQPTPFQAEVDRLGRQIGYGALGLIVVVSAVQALLTAASPLTVLLVGVTLAVAVVPEGLPAVVTFTLALGSRRLVERNALVRRLPVVESLGSVDVIVTDKTGTLTENQMTVERVYAGGETYAVTGTGTDTAGEFRLDGEVDDAPDLEAVLRCGAVCNDAERAPASADREFYGDPTEVALLVAAAKAGVEATATRRREIPFTSERKRMTVVAAESGTLNAYTKGAPEVVLERCDRVLEGGRSVDLTPDRRTAILEANRALASDAMRVLGFAVTEGVDPDASDEAVESGMTFLGLQGMLDPPRAEVPAAVEDCRRAGVRVVMVTGDNVETAKAVGETVGFDPTGALVGRDVADRTDEALRRDVESVEVFARVDPEHKVRILRALQANDHVVAMTGDGVNDAPALRGADVGVSMGVRGTDVAQQASDVVLLDDNFATIRDAIAEGRGVFDNVRKFVNYLLSANAGEVLVVFCGVIVGTALFASQFAARAEALILTPIMLLWVNLVTDGLPALALGADPKTADVLDRPPRARGEPVIDRHTLASVVSIGAIMTVTGLALFFATLVRTDSLVTAQTRLFTFLVAVEIVRIQVIRSRYGLSIASNPWLGGAIGITLALQSLVLYTPLADYFDVHPISPDGWVWIAVAFAGFLALNLASSAIFDRLFETSSGDRGGEDVPRGDPGP